MKKAKSKNKKRTEQRKREKQTFSALHLHQRRELRTILENGLSRHGITREVMRQLKQDQSSTHMALKVLRGMGGVQEVLAETLERGSRMLQSHQWLARDPSRPLMTGVMIDLLLCDLVHKRTRVKHDRAHEHEEVTSSGTHA